MCRQCGNSYQWARPDAQKERQSQLCPDCWYKPFCITSVARADLAGLLTPERLGGLNDANMREIADEMADAYLNSGFWRDLEVITQDVRLPQKRRAA